MTRYVENLTVSELLDIDSWCDVCTGRSPRWDGHSYNPPCQGAAREEIVRRAEAYDEAVFKKLLPAVNLRLLEYERERSNSNLQR